MHGRRQPVSWDDQLNLVTGETRVYIYFVQYTDCLGNKEEGAGYVRWVRPECPGLHARGNAIFKGMQLRKEEQIS